MVFTGQMTSQGKFYFTLSNRISAMYRDNAVYKGSQGQKTNVLLYILSKSFFLRSLITKRPQKHLNLKNLTGLCYTNDQTSTQYFLFVLKNVV